MCGGPPPLCRKLYVGESFSSIFSFQNHVNFDVRGFSVQVQVVYPSTKRALVMDTSSEPVSIPIKSTHTKMVSFPLHEPGDYMFVCYLASCVSLPPWRGRPIE